MTEALLGEEANGRIQDALYHPELFAHREMGESMEHYRAKAIASALHYDDEELAGMGLGVNRAQGAPTFSRARDADDATPEFTPPEAASSEPWRMPSLERHGRQYRHQPPWADAPPVALAAAIVASVAFVLAVIALMT